MIPRFELRQGDDYAWRSYLSTDGKLSIHHHRDDGGLWTQPPADQIVYDTEIVELQVLTQSARYYTCHHAEAQFLERGNGDSIKHCPSHEWQYELPKTETCISGRNAPSASPLAYGKQRESGGGNPAVLGGPDGHLYMIAVVVTPDHRHGWILASVRPFVNTTLKVWTGQSWQRFGRDVMPAILRDTEGQEILSQPAPDIHSTQGLITSLFTINRKTWALYVDRADQAGKFLLLARWTYNIANPHGWSPAQVIRSDFTQPIIIHVAPARAHDRLAVLWTGWHTYGTVSDLCLDYTTSLDPRSIAALQMDGSKALHLAQGNGLRAQPGLLRDWCGRLTVPAPEKNQPTRGGFVTWMDQGPPAAPMSPYGRPSYRAGWYVEDV